MFRKEDWELNKVHLLAQQDILKKLMETLQVCLINNYTVSSKKALQKYKHGGVKNLSILDTADEGP